MSRPSKRPRLLQPSKISELNDTDSDKVRASSDISSVERGTECVPGLSQPQPFHQTASSHESSSSISSSASDKTEDASDSALGEQIQHAVTCNGHAPLALRAVQHTHIQGAPEERTMKRHINDGSSPLSVFLLYFAEIITLLVVETNCYYHDYTDRLDDGPSPEPDVTEAKMFVFLALTIQMGHGVRQTDRLVVNSGPALHTFLRHYDERGPIPSHPSLLTLY